MLTLAAKYPTSVLTMPNIPSGCATERVLSKADEGSKEQSRNRLAAHQRVIHRHQQRQFQVAEILKKPRQIDLKQNRRKRHEKHAQRADADLAVPSRNLGQEPVGGELGHGLAGVSDRSGFGLAAVARLCEAVQLGEARFVFEEQRLFRFLLAWGRA